ncbi:unnamed protein product [Vitrella brassicaformis CCMP3155]|uniref:Uncharacterized protein n=1 Tax=Vitrella brassicaformis (strain CCMP3155) TaxID=1169540 RepID=A0A0G4FKY6_VITBC|nr:unnamed protein product [Vitrella brassicaformis CCMP3155]|eukprot:CEM14637.1 unnamed protein product [Vitrella brassicaformis CCMP3155]
METKRAKKELADKKNDSLAVISDVLRDDAEFALPSRIQRHAERIKNKKATGSMELSDEQRHMLESEAAAMEQEEMASIRIAALEGQTLNTSKTSPQRDSSGVKFKSNATDMDEAEDGEWRDETRQAQRKAKLLNRKVTGQLMTAAQKEELNRATQEDMEDGDEAEDDEYDKDHPNLVSFKSRETDIDSDADDWKDESRHAKRKLKLMGRKATGQIRMSQTQKNELRRASEEAMDDGDSDVGSNDADGHDDQPPRGANLVQFQSLQTDIDSDADWQDASQHAQRSAKLIARKATGQLQMTELQRRELEDDDEEEERGELQDDQPYLVSFKTQETDIDSNPDWLATGRLRRAGRS